MKKSNELEHLNDYVNDVTNEQQQGENLEYSEREVLEMLESYKIKFSLSSVSNRRELLIAYEIKMSSCSDEQAEIKVDSYMASISN